MSAVIWGIAVTITFSDQAAGNVVIRLPLEISAGK